MVSSIKLAVLQKSSTHSLSPPHTLTAQQHSSDELLAADGWLLEFISLSLRQSAFFTFVSSAWASPDIARFEDEAFLRCFRAGGGLIAMQDIVFCLSYALNAPSVENTLRCWQRGHDVLVNPISGCLFLDAGVNLGSYFDVHMVAPSSFFLQQRSGSLYSVPTHLQEFISTAQICFLLSYLCLLLLRFQPIPMSSSMGTFIAPPPNTCLLTGNEVSSSLHTFCKSIV